MNVARNCADSICLKMIDMAADSLDELEVRDTVGSEVESMCGVESVYIFRQVGLSLFVGRKDGVMVYFPVRESSIFSQAIEKKKPVIVNEVAKDREVVNEVREALNFKQKVHNLMIVPFGQNVGKQGGALIIILLNKYSMNEEDKPVFEPLQPQASPVCNKVFQQTFVNVLD